jgi:TatD DNase family protein
MTLPLVDTHCHLLRFADPESLMAEAETRGSRFVAVVMKPDELPALTRLIEGRACAMAAVGLHPVHAMDCESAVPALLAAMGATRFIGEVGLDATVKDAANVEAQRRVFEAVLTRADELGDRVLTIHGRRAWRDVLDAIGDGLRATPILHWYSGSVALARRAVRQGCCFSVNTAMVGTEAAAELLREVPADRILLETDGPYIQVGGAPAGPEHLAQIVAYIASCWGTGPDAAAERIHRNWLEHCGAT